jgi:hypothetical protein
MRNRAVRRLLGMAIMAHNQSVMEREASRGSEKIPVRWLLRTMPGVTSPHLACPPMRGELIPVSSSCLSRTCGREKRNFYRPSEARELAKGTKTNFVR